MKREELVWNIEQWTEDYDTGIKVKEKQTLSDYIADKISTVYRDSVIDECASTINNINTFRKNVNKCNAIKKLKAMKTGGR